MPDEKTRHTAVTKTHRPVVQREPESKQPRTDAAPYPGEDERKGIQNIDREDILQELGQLQHIMGKVNSEMLRIHDLLKQS